MKLTRISITEEKLGEFYVDSFMKVTYFPFVKGVGFWETHVSQLNEGVYNETHENFLDFLYNAGLTELYIDIHEFKRLMEKVFQAYCLLR